MANIVYLYYGPIDKNGIVGGGVCMCVRARSLIVFVFIAQHANWVLTCVVCVKHTRESSSTLDHIPNVIMISYINIVHQIVDLLLFFPPFLSPINRTKKKNGNQVTVSVCNFIMWYLRTFAITSISLISRRRRTKYFFVSYKYDALFYHYHYSAINSRIAELCNDTAHPPDSKSVLIAIGGTYTRTHTQAHTQTHTQTHWHTQRRANEC